MPSALASLGPCTVTGSPSNSSCPSSKALIPAMPFALAGPVVAHERGHAAGLDVEVDVMEHVDGAEALVDAPQGEQRRHETPFAAHAFFSAAVVQIFADVVKPSLTTSLTLSLKIACGWSSTLLTC